MAKSTVVLTVSSVTPYFHRIDGEVTQKGGMLSIETPYEIGGIRRVTKTFPAASVEAYRLGKTGFIIYMETTPVIRAFGELSSKNDDSISVETEYGQVVVNNSPRSIPVLMETDSDSREARFAMKISRPRLTASQKSAASGKAKPERKASKKKK